MEAIVGNNTRGNTRRKDRTTGRDLREREIDTVLPFGLYSIADFEMGLLVELVSRACGTLWGRTLES